jgi:hypothetical protein
MAKVIVERPRFGSSLRGKSKGYRRRLQRMGPDNLPAREGMKMRHQGHTKWLNEHLGPLRRYLDAQVGRPWNKVFSEICAHIDRNSAVQDHVRDHVSDYVATQVIEIDGVPCSNSSRLHGYPLSELYSVYWYVCPRSGILKRVKRRKRPRRRPPVSELMPPRIRVGDALQCRLIEGAWHVIGLKPIPRQGRINAERDVVLGCLASKIDPETARKHYGADVFASAMRRLSRRELGQYPIPFELWH